jgi:hypothetical protein
MTVLELGIEKWTHAHKYLCFEWDLYLRRKLFIEYSHANRVGYNRGPYNRRERIIPSTNSIEETRYYISSSKEE